MSDHVAIKRALISVSDKTGLVDFARSLVQTHGVELVSTGGTARTLREAGLPTIDVSELTGFPEMMDGRVKTLHPRVHGGLLALRDDPAHIASMQAHGIQPIDLVVINLYPFEQTVAKPGCTFEHAIENIDIGGPSMVRSAAKNHRFVTVVTDPSDYASLLDELRTHQGATTLATRTRLAQQAFARTHAYDGAIARYLSQQASSQPAAPALEPAITLNLKLKQPLRYGENPHQLAGLYAEQASSLASARQHHGKELSYINLLDADAALACVRDFVVPAACIVKHATPCGVGTGNAIDQAFDRAYASDPVAAFGGIVALNRRVDHATASVIVAGQKFLEVIVAPGYDADALELLKERWKNVRLLEVNDSAAAILDIRSISGGFLVQQRDAVGLVESEWKVVTRRQPTDAERRELAFAWLAVKHVKSNAIVIARDGATVGIGGGQVDRVGASRIAIDKAGDRARGAVVASDAFFPFPDGPELLLKAGAVAFIQPGGSQRDQLTIDAIDRAGAAMIFTGRRHFRH